MEWLEWLNPGLWAQNVFADCPDDANEAHQTIHANFFEKKKREIKKKFLEKNFSKKRLDSKKYVFVCVRTRVFEHTNKINSNTFSSNPLYVA